MLEQDKLDKLNKLVIDDNEFIDLIYDVLEPFVKIRQDKIIPKAAYTKLNERKKILILLIARKAMKILNLIETETLQPKEIAIAAGVNHSSVKVYLTKYAKDRIVIKKKEGYLISESKFSHVKEMIFNEKN